MSSSVPTPRPCSRPARSTTTSSAASGSAIRPSSTIGRSIPKNAVASRGASSADAVSRPSVPSASTSIAPKPSTTPADATPGPSVANSGSKLAGSPSAVTMTSACPVDARKRGYAESVRRAPARAARTAPPVTRSARRAADPAAARRAMPDHARNRTTAHRRVQAQNGGWRQRSDGCAQLERAAPMLPPRAIRYTNTVRTGSDQQRDQPERLASRRTGPWLRRTSADEQEDEDQQLDDQEQDQQRPEQLAQAHRRDRMSGERLALQRLELVGADRPCVEQGLRRVRSRRRARGDGRSPGAAHPSRGALASARAAMPSPARTGRRTRKGRGARAGTAPRRPSRCRSSRGRGKGPR